MGNKCQPEMTKRSLIWITNNPPRLSPTKQMSLALSIHTIQQAT